MMTTAPDVDVSALASPAPSVKVPPTVRVNVAFARMVVLSMTRAPPSLSPRVAIVNVTVPAALEANVTLLNSSSARFAPANVIVPPPGESNITVPVPASQEADVLEFDHDPFMVHVSDPKSM